MKPTASQINSFLRSPDPPFRAVLLFGPDAGLVRERADGIAKKIVPDQKDPFRASFLAPSALSADPARLYDEAATQTMGGGRRIVRIQHAPDSLASPLMAFLEDPPPGDSLLIIESGDLDKRSKLRALCEGSNQRVIAIPCYLEDAAQRVRTVAALLEAEGLKASRDVLSYLADSLPADRLAMRSETEKLALYARGKHSVTLSDAQAALHNAAAAEIDDLVHAVASGDVKRAALLIDHLLSEQTSPVALLRAAQRHFLRLQLARAHVDKGLAPKAAIEKLQPKVFWKHVEHMARQVQRWPSASIEGFLSNLCDAEATVKNTGTPDAALVSQLLLQATASRT